MKQPQSPNPETSMPPVVVEELLQVYRGRMPHPGAMRQYEQLYLGAATSFFDRLKEQSDHRMEMETLMVNAKIRMQTQGSWFGFILALSALVGGLALTAAGIDTAGIILAVSGLSALIAVFVVGEARSRIEPWRTEDRMGHRPLR